MHSCQECGVEITIKRPRDRRKRYCTRQCWLKELHRSGQVPYAKNSSGVVKHGHSMAVSNTVSREYRAWKSMKGRCKNHPYYVKHKITVYEDWKEFTSFLAYITGTIGPHPGSGWSLDRIDNDKNYEPGNIRWATVIQQRHNQRRWIERHHNSE